MVFGHVCILVVMGFSPDATMEDLYANMATIIGQGGSFINFKSISTST